MTSTSDYLLKLCRATNTQPQPDVITRMAGAFDAATVAAMIELIEGKDMASVFYKFARRSLTLLEIETLDWVESIGFVSSREAGEHFGVQPSTAVNRLKQLKNKGVLCDAFEFVPATGGSRQYYRPFNGPIDAGRIEAFAARLGEGRTRKEVL